MNASELRAGFDGPILEPGDDGYEQARTIFNAMIDRRPAVIAQCESAPRTSPRRSPTRGPTSSRSRSAAAVTASPAPALSDGLVVDMRRMNAVEVDAGARTATAQGGATWSDFDRATQPHGLMTTGGRVSTTGVAGLTLGGGSGWLERMFGFACDTLISVDPRDRRRPHGHRERGREPGAVLGPARWRRQLRRRDRACLLGSRSLPASTLALLLWPAERRAGGGRRLSRPDRRRRAASSSAAASPTSRGPPEEFVPEHLRDSCLRGRDRRLRGAGGRDARGDGADPGARAGGRDGRRDAVPRPAVARSTTRPGFATTGRPSTSTAPRRRAR